jgi:hypothetical protein
VNKPLEVKIQNKGKRLHQHRLLQSLLFFCKETLSPYSDILRAVHFNLSEETLKSVGITWCNEDTAFVLLNPKKIASMIKKKMLYANYKKSFFFILLHEIAHVLQFVMEFRKGNFRDLKACVTEMVKKEKALEEAINVAYPELDEFQIHLLLPDEVNANQFAHKNLAYFENLYSFEGMLWFDSILV